MKQGRTSKKSVKNKLLWSICCFFKSMYSLVLSNILLLLFGRAKCQIPCRTTCQNLREKLGQQRAICWNSLGLFRDFGLNYIFFRNKTFLFFKIESWNFQHLFEKEFRETSQNFNSFSSFRNFLFPFFLSVVLLSWKQMLKISAFYLEKQQKKFYSYKNMR